MSKSTAFPQSEPGRAVWLRRGVIALVIVTLLIVYLSTLQTRINGSSNEYMIDVGEIQVALNLWGTIHHTCYPLFALAGNVFTLPIRALDLIEPAAAASLYATAWGIVALGAFGLLVAKLTARPALAAGSVLVQGVTRSIWIHNVIAEVYSMSLAITALMLLVALWPAPWEGAWSVRRRILWLALLGGIGVSHHRAVAFVAPGLFLAVAPHLRDSDLRWARTLPQAIGLATLGFVPYLYLPLRAQQDTAWVYGEPGSWDGFWTEFTGREADRLVTLPEGADGWIDNLGHALTLLTREMTVPGLVLGLAALIVVLIAPRHRQTARILTLSAVGPFAFTVAYRTAVLQEAILMPVIMVLVMALALAADLLITQRERIAPLLLAGCAIWTGVLIGWRHATIHDLVTDPTGQDTIALLESIPTDEPAAFMLPWGPRYAAAAYAHLVTKSVPDVQTLDHKADYRAILASGTHLYTEPETFYTYPLPWDTPYGPASEWWSIRLDNVYLHAAAPGIVELAETPWHAPASDESTPLIYGIARTDARLVCDDHAIHLYVTWTATTAPDGDPSIFVHLTGDEPAPDPPNADSRHPVYGLYPFARWQAGEIVTDIYTLPYLPDKTQVSFGLYEQDASGAFVNYGETVLPVTGCESHDDAS